MIMAFDNTLITPILTLVVLFTPTLIAVARHHPRIGRVILLNLCFFTFICWFLAMREALAPARKSVSRRRQDQNSLDSMVDTYLVKEAFDTTYTEAYLFNKLMK
jgi:hypothetical protein